MEPGSTFKLATMLTLLDDARMPVSTVYDTHNGDPVTVGPARNIRDSHRGDREIDFRRAVASSSNVYFAKAIWDRYGSTGRKQEYSDFLHKELHLGQTVGLERLGERKPSVTTDWKVPDPGVMLVKMSYGYRVRLAPIQMITFYNAIANGGKMISPVLVRELRRGDRVEERFESRTIASSIAARAALREVQPVSYTHLLVPCFGGGFFLREKNAARAGWRFSAPGAFTESIPRSRRRGKGCSAAGRARRHRRQRGSPPCRAVRR